MVPVIDVAPLLNGGDKSFVAKAINAACRDTGFFYVVGHGVSETLQEKLDSLSRKFFSLDEKTKMKIAMAKGGRAWRGFFPVGNELTSGVPDQKEGIYFGEELASDHPLPLHGKNLFPSEIPEMKQVVLDYIDAITKLGHVLMAGISLSLGLEESYFSKHYTHDPLVLFRIFHYPAPKDPTAWGVGEHTDYGVLTILKQDDCGGLQVRSKKSWIEAPFVKGSFVCNIGDMLDRMTGGLYRSTPHRVKNVSGRSRLSFPFFFDPNFQSEVKPLPIVDKSGISDDKHERWDRASVHAFQGTYGEYLLGKVSKVFPELKNEVLSR